MVTVHNWKLARGYRRLLVACAVLAAACQGPASLTARRQLDPVTGMTLMSAGKALVFARTEGSYSRSARDYIYVGPVETNRQGRRDYYLWVGIATTLDRGFVAPDAAAPQSLLLNVEGSPMELPLVPWSDVGASRDSLDVYTPAVRVHSELGARVTLHQLELMTSTPLDTLTVIDQSGRTRAYRRWDSEHPLSGFMTELTVPNPVASR